MLGLDKTMTVDHKIMFAINEVARKRVISDRSR